MAELTLEESLAKNRIAFAKMNLEQRTEMRRVLQEGMDMPGIFKAMAFSKQEQEEAPLLIKMIDEMNLAEVMNKRKPVANQF